MALYLCWECDEVRDADYMGCNEHKGNHCCDDCYADIYEQEQIDTAKTLEFNNGNK